MAAAQDRHSGTVCETGPGRREESCGMAEGRKGGSAVPAVQAGDTLRVLEKKGETLVAGDSVLDRSRIYAIQTPQVFWSETLLDAYRQAFDTAFTDDASVVAKKGIPLSYVQGERYNLKITTPEDLALAEAILLRRG